MLHPEKQAGNPITGKTCWLIRCINGDWGDPIDWGVVVIRKHYLDHCAELRCLNGAFFERSHYREMRGLLRSMGFNNAKAMRRGKWKYYMVI